MCDGHDSRIHIQCDFNLTGAAGGEYRVVECAVCGFRYVDPQPSPEELAASYATDYLAHLNHVAPDQAVDREQASLGRRFIQVARQRLTMIERWLPGPWNGVRVLDIGCGNGAFLLEVAKRHPVEAWGVDPAAEPLHNLARVGEANGQRLRLVCGSLAAADLPESHFDLITLWHVLEHDGDPIGNLERVRRWLRPGGLVVAEVPNAGGLIARMCGSSWLGWDLPRHLVHFSARTLGQAAHEAGLTRIRVLREYTLNPLCLSPMLASLAIWHRRRRGRTRMKRVNYRRWDGLAGTALRLVNGVERLLGGNGLLLVARKGSHQGNDRVTG